MKAFALSVLTHRHAHVFVSLWRFAQCRDAVVAVRLVVYVVAVVAVVLALLDVVVVAVAARVWALEVVMGSVVVVVLMLLVVLVVVVVPVFDHWEDCQRSARRSRGGGREGKRKI